MKITASCFIWVFLVFSIVFFSSCRRGDVLSNEVPDVIVAPVIKKKIKESMNAVGQVVAKDSVYLHARVRGFLEKRNFNEGSFVKKGDILFQIEKDQYLAKVNAAKARLQTAEANLKTAIIEFNRQKYLVKNDAVSKRNFDIAANDKAISAAKVLEERALLEEATLNLSYTDIKAPFSGRIGIAKYSIGNLVGPMLSDPLAYIAMIDPIRVEFNINEGMMVSILQYELLRSKGFDAESGKIPTLKDITTKLRLANNTFYKEQGEIDFIDNVINPMTGTIMIRAVFENPNSVLIPGAYVNVLVEAKDEVERLLIQQAAIQEDQTGSYVLLVDKNNKVDRRNIKTGTIFGTYIVVLKGLKEGDMVIKEGLQKTRDGATVKPHKEEKSTFPKEKTGKKGKLKKKQLVSKSNIDKKTESDTVLKKEKPEAGVANTDKDRVSAEQQSDSRQKEDHNKTLLPSSSNLPVKRQNAQNYIKQTDSQLQQAGTDR